MPGSFPRKLHELLNTVHEEGLEWIVSWSPQGNGFKVHKVKEFVSDILPRFFMRQTKYKSFQRQLNIWDFDRITKGPLIGSYVHSKFLRGNPSLCLHMIRQERPVPCFNPVRQQSQIEMTDPKEFKGKWRGAAFNDRIMGSGSHPRHQKNQQVNAHPMTLNECIAFFCAKNEAHSECQEMASTNPVNSSMLPPIVGFDNLLEACFPTEDPVEPIHSSNLADDPYHLDDLDVGMAFHPTSLMEPVLHDMEMIFS